MGTRRQRNAAKTSERKAVPCDNNDNAKDDNDDDNDKKGENNDDANNNNTSNNASNNTRNWDPHPEQELSQLFGGSVVSMHF